ncbi:MAG: hypothetical protein HRT58_00120 [Crocinitomicaceae bacterium]|nr:hypothetical protein [Flavobacteriales bacterium]NQZ34025.1 hypothetical protein [Crocinitomicaceae bacterium]
MKNIVLVAVCALWIQSAICQETEGYVQYDIEVQAVDTTLKSKQSAGMLRNSKMEVFFAQNFSRVNFQMGQLYNLSAVVDLNSNRTISLMSGVMGNFAMRTMVNDTTVVDSIKPVATVEILEGSKVILGYTCKKALLTVNGLESTYWYTNDIDIDISGQQITNVLIPGFPLEFFTVADGVLMHFRASNIEFELEDKEELFFTTIPEDYVIMQDIDQ